MRTTEISRVTNSEHKQIVMQAAGSGKCRTLSSSCIWLALALTFPPPAPAQDSVSKAGVLPVYGVNFRLDPSWIDGTTFPSQPDPAFQRIWETLRPNGFSVVRFPVDVTDSKSAAVRVANLCLW